MSVALIACAALAAEPDDDSTVNAIVELNKKALVMYERLDVSGAAQALEQALALCAGDLANHSVAARTHLHLGIVYVSGLKKRDQGLVEFKNALAIDPKIKVATSLLNPEVEAVFDEAASSPTSPESFGQAPAATVRREHLAIHHPPVTRGTRGQPVPIKVQVPPGLSAARVILAYQAEGTGLFLAREMVPIKGSAGWYEEAIPTEATKGSQVDYYLEAQNPDDQPIANDGTPEEPHHVVLVPEAAPEEEKPAVVKDTSNSASVPGLWLVLAIGSGGGYHAGTPEMNPVDNNFPQGSIHVSGWGMARLGHLAPEIGFFAKENLVISVQGRLQSVSGTQEITVDRTTYRPAEYAIAGVAKLSWLARASQRRLRPFLAAELGAGQIRHAITTPSGANLTGCGDGPTCSDTVVGGLGLAGAGAGMIFRLDENLAAYAAVNLLMGVPSFMVNGDVNVGIAVIR